MSNERPSGGSSSSDDDKDEGAVLKPVSVSAVRDGVFPGGRVVTASHDKGYLVCVCVAAVPLLAP